MMSIEIYTTPNGDVKDVWSTLLKPSEFLVS